jgi:hypothetical protein
MAVDLQGASRANTEKSQQAALQHKLFQRAAREIIKSSEPH